MGRPAAQAQTVRVTQAPPGELFDDIQRFIDEKLFAPQEIADVCRFAQAKTNADFLAHLRWDGQGQVAGGVIGGKVNQDKDDKADQDQNRHRKNQPPYCVVEHLFALDPQKCGAPPAAPH